VTLSRAPDNLGRLTPTAGSADDREVLAAAAFKRRMSIERKRTERSTKPFLLMLMETGQYQSRESNLKIFSNITAALLAKTRETDVIGWYQEQDILGVMFTDLVIYDKNSLLSTMLTRVSNILRDNLTFEQFNRIGISFHFFPDTWDGNINQRPSNPTLYADLARENGTTRMLAVSKRAMDIVGSILLLIVCCPLFLLISLAIKATSKGTVLFKQQRIGQYGKPFTFLKFRSMHAGNDPTVHQEYVMKLIAGNAQSHPSDGHDGGVYKLTKDSRVTPLGTFLRRSSLDELPQLLNVLFGQMSLVGPRPALPYEVAAYQTWHRRRVLEVKPGITGLWQVSGRCRLKFDDMVRLDLRYAKSWSPWLDIKILVRTPKVVLSGDGAY
jgi:lipopolysaccharide/colanic/teichoic acid biosynthesis glycosyltransferase